MNFLSFFCHVLLPGELCLRYSSCLWIHYFLCLRLPLSTVLSNVAVAVIALPGLPFSLISGVSNFQMNFVLEFVEWHLVFQRDCFISSELCRIAYSSGLYRLHVLQGLEFGILPWLGVPSSLNFTVA
jgi:hypothetical protein